MPVRRYLPGLLGLFLSLLWSTLSEAQAYRFNRLDFTVGLYPGGVAVADFNQDGKLDVALTDGTQGNVTILMGTANGTFVQRTHPLVAPSASGIVAGDFNNDGKVDLAVADWGNGVSVFLGKGNGTFGAAIKASVNGYASLIAVADFNHDGNLDVAASDNSSNTISVLLGHGDGSFAPYASYVTPSFTIGVVAADFNGDGNPDLAFADTYGNDAYVMLGNGDGTFQAGTSFDAGEIPVRLAAGDFNGDGKMDLAVSDGPDCGCAFLSILLGNGDGTFQAPLTTSADGWANIIVGDFNHDKKMDLATTEGGVLSIFLGNGDGTFQPHVKYGSFATAIALASGDFNRDGRTDLVVANFNANNASHLSTFVGNGDGTFGSMASYATGLDPVGIVAADFSGDHNIDLATVNSGDSSISILTGTGLGTFKAPVNYPVSSGQFGPIVTADFNGDGHPDLASVNSSAGTVSILLNQGNGTFGAYKDYAAGASADSLVAGDFNKDGKTDLIVGYGSGLVLLAGNGSGGFNAPVTFGAGLTPSSLASADFNGDGNLDVAVVSSSTAVVSVFLGNGNGTFGSAVGYPLQGGSFVVLAGDFNGDHKQDLAVLNSFSVDILLGNGDGTFQNHLAYAAVPYASWMISADFNGSGVLDLVVSSTTNSIAAILPGNGAGAFGTATPYYVGAGLTGLVAADFDHNGSTDLATTNAILGGGAVTVLLNKAVAALSSNALNFPTTAVGTNSSPKSIQFSNPGTAPVTIRSISLTGTNGGDFSVTNNCSFKLTVGGSCTVTVVFSPTQKGKRLAQLKFTDDASGGSQTVSLFGTGS